MGATIAKFMRLVGSSEARILMLGLDAAGKTTILYRFKLGDVVTTIPTIGFNVETVEYKHLRMTVWDVGGQDRIRPLWRHYYEHTDALIWVVDTCDRDRIDVARKELSKLLDEDELRNVALLVYANKQDMPNAMSIAKLSEALGLTGIKDRVWYVQGTCGVSGDGLYEGLDWLADRLTKSRRRSM
eukprot:m51a1_g304 putative adp-ribosylation factor (185) ;mRNA; f:384194-384748